MATGFGAVVVGDRSRAARPPRKSKYSAVLTAHQIALLHRKGEPAEGSVWRGVQPFAQLLLTRRPNGVYIAALAVLLRIQSHGGIPVSHLATYLGKIDRAYVRFAAVEEISAYALELGSGPKTLGPEAEDIAYSARRARRFVAVEDRLTLIAVRLASPGECEIAAGAANAAKATAGALEQVGTLKKVRQAEADTRLKRAAADSAEMEVDLESATSDAELRARRAEVERRAAVARADTEEAQARARFAHDREALEVRREAVEVAQKELEMYHEMEHTLPDSEAVPRDAQLQIPSQSWCLRPWFV